MSNDKAKKSGSPEVEPKRVPGMHFIKRGRKTII